MNVDAEIAYENIEGELGAGGNQDRIGVVTRVVEVNRVADAEIELEGIELRDGPETIDVDLRTQDDAVLRFCGHYDRAGRAGKRKGGIFGQVDIVVVLDPH